MPNEQNYCSKVCTSRQLGIGDCIAEFSNGSLHYLPLDTRPPNPIVSVIKTHPGMDVFEIFSNQLKTLLNSYKFSTYKVLENTAYADFKNCTLPLLDAIGLNSVLGKRLGVGITKSFLFFPAEHRVSPVANKLYFAYLVGCPVKHDGNFNLEAPEMQRCAQERFLYNIQQYPNLKLALLLCNEPTTDYFKKNLLPHFEKAGIECLFLPDPDCKEAVQKFLESPKLDEARNKLEEILLK